MNFLEELCNGLDEKTQMKIKAAYWQGCADGVKAANSPDVKIERQEGNVVFLRQDTDKPTRWIPPEV